MPNFTVTPAASRHRASLLSATHSHVHALVAKWWHSRLPTLEEIPAARAALWTAATHQITHLANHGHAYDPLADCRFLWATQWLDRAAGLLREITPAIQRQATLCFDTPNLPPRHDLPRGT